MVEEFPGVGFPSKFVNDKLVMLFLPLSDRGGGLALKLLPSVGSVLVRTEDRSSCLNVLPKSISHPGRFTALLLPCFMLIRLVDPIFKGLMK